MQREIMNGIPYLTDGKGSLYTWNTASPVRIGTYSTTTKQLGKQPIFDINAIRELEPLIEQWRTEQKPRPRKQPKPE